MRPLFTTVLVIYCLCGSPPQSGFAQKPAPQNHVDIPSIEELQKEIERAEQAKDLDDAAKTSISALYREAIEDLKLVKTWELESQKFEQMAASAAEEIAQVKARLADETAKSLPEISSDATLAYLENKLDEAEKTLEAARQARAEAEIEPQRRTIRRLQIEQLLKEANKRAASLERQKKSPAVERPAAPLEFAQRARLMAAIAAVQLEIQGYTKELAAHNATTELLPLQSDLSARDAARAKKALDKLKGRVAELRRLEAEAQISKASQEAAMADPALHDMAEENEKLATERRDLIVKIKHDNEVLSDTLSKLDAIERDFARDENQLKSVGRTYSVTLLTKKSLPNTRPYINAIEDRQEEIRKIQVRIFRLADLRAELVIAENETDETAAEDEEGLTPEEQAEQAASLEAFRDFRKTQKQYVTSLLKEYNRRFNLLVELNTAQQKLVDETDAYQDFVDEQVFWIRSASPIWDVPDWPGVGDLQNSFRTAYPAALLKSLFADFRSNPLLWISAILAIGLLMYARRDAKPTLRDIGDRATAAGIQRFWPTVQATLLTALLSVPALGGLAFLAWRMSAAADVPEPTRAFATGLFWTAIVFLPVEFFRQTCRSRGLAESHFGWPSSSVSSLHKYFSRLILAALPLLAAAIAFDDTGRQNTLGRICFIAAFLTVAWIMHFVLRKQGDVYRGFLAQHPEGWLSRGFRVGWIFTAVFPVLLCFIAALGYYFTAWRLANRWLATVLLALGLLVAGAFLFRWILIIRRRMAIEASRRQREEALKLINAESDAAKASEPASAPAADIGPDLDTINRQARRLVFVILGVVGACCVWLIWDDVFPALGILRGVPLWSTEMQASQGGVAISRIITLADLAWAVLILGLAFVAARNIPGLLEMSILRQMTVDKGLRFAITTVCRYVLAGIGIVWACNYIGLSWGKVQWILAAMSVGLGFGLQEIFANFASGMVILFERPIRIGDIITIGDTSGKVLRIQMRATTILDWDKKELVVPNKEFATGRLLNWTLTDTVNRLVFDVGVSYKSDPEQVRELLLKIAAEHPKVVESPKPICIFKNFGASSLEFSLRVYLESMKGRLDVIHEMHANIHKAFREAGIEIAYPQLDLHVRSGLNRPSDETSGPSPDDMQLQDNPTGGQENPAGE